MRTSARANGSLRGRKPGDRHTVRRAANVVEPGLVEELDTRRVSAVLAAYADLEVGPDAPAQLAAPGDQPSDALSVELLEGIKGQDAITLTSAERRDGRTLGTRC